MTDQHTGNEGENNLRASIRAIDFSDEEIQITVRLSNRSSRALHYISDVRTTKYDPETRTLELALSDEGREVIPGAMQKLPNFKYVDPESETEIQLSVPNRIVKLARTDPPGGIAFEAHQLSEAEQVVVRIGWAEVPYYKDTRATDDPRLPAARWEQHQVVVTERIRR